MPVDDCSLFSLSSSLDYLNSLKSSPAMEASYRLLAALEEGEEVSLFYEFQKPGVCSLMAQWFLFRGERIAETRLVWDS